MTQDEQQPAAFAVKDCALAAIATGKRAQNVRELRDHLADVHSGCIYYHFWGGLLRPRFDDPEYNNDFASWARHALHDATLAERLGVIDPGSFSDMEALRRELIDTLEERPGAAPGIRGGKPAQRRRARARLARGDVVFVRDPQPAALLAHLPQRRGKWIWRCHVDVSHPYRPVWKYLRDRVARFDASIFSLADFAQMLPHPVYLHETSAMHTRNRGRERMGRLARALQCRRAPYRSGDARVLAAVRCACGLDRDRIVRRETRLSVGRAVLRRSTIDGLAHTGPTRVLRSRLVAIHAAIRAGGIYG